MNPRILAPLICFALLTGCVTASPDNLLSAEPQGAPKKDGQYPIFGRIPVGQTTHLTPTQKAEMQAEMARNKRSVEGQSRSNSQADYLTEVERLKQLAQDRIDSLTDRIEGESEAGQAGDS